MKRSLIRMYLSGTMFIFFVAPPFEGNVGRRPGEGLYKWGAGGGGGCARDWKERE